MSEPIKVWAVGQYRPEKCWWIKGPVSPMGAGTESTVVGDDGRLRAQYVSVDAERPPSDYHLTYEDAKVYVLQQLRSRLSAIDTDYRVRLDDEKKKLQAALEQLERER